MRTVWRKRSRLERRAILRLSQGLQIPLHLIVDSLPWWRRAWSKATAWRYRNA